MKHEPKPTKQIDTKVQKLTEATPRADGDAVPSPYQAPNFIKDNARKKEFC